MKTPLVLINTDNPTHSWRYPSVDVVVGGGQLPCKRHLPAAKPYPTSTSLPCCPLSLFCLSISLSSLSSPLSPCSGKKFASQPWGLPSPRLLETPSTPPPPTHTPKPKHTHTQTQQLSTTINNTSLTGAKCSFLARSSYGKHMCLCARCERTHALHRRWLWGFLCGVVIGTQVTDDEEIFDHTSLKEWF